MFNMLFQFVLNLVEGPHYHKIHANQSNHQEVKVIKQCCKVPTQRNHPDAKKELKHLTIDEGYYIHP